MRPLRTPQNNPQSVAIGAASTQSVAFGANSKYIRLVATQNCYVAFGANPTALVTSILLIANVVEFFGVTPGQKLAVLEVGTAGTLSVVEGNAM